MFKAFECKIEYRKLHGVVTSDKARYKCNLRCGSDFDLCLNTAHDTIDASTADPLIFKLCRSSKLICFDDCRTKFEDKIHKRKFMKSIGT